MDSSNVCIQEAKDSKGKTVALFVGDTVEVKAGEPGVILTPTKKKVQTFFSFFF